MSGAFFKRYFLTGLFLLVPIGLSAAIVIWIFHLADAWASPLTVRLLGRHIPGVGIVVTVLLIFLTGLLSSNVIGRWVLEALDRLLLDLPVFRTLYSTSKQLMQAFSPQGGAQAFQSVVLVRDPGTGVLRMGFRTRDLEIRVDGQIRLFVAVYVPTNHLYLGDTYLFDAAQVLPTRLTVQEGVQCIISAGAALPPTLPTE